CASILWKSAERAADAAKAMGITSDRLHELGLVDKVVSEPLGGAHRDPALMAANLKLELVSALDKLQALSVEELLERRYDRLMAYGVSQG
ncbi:MAG: acetyl-CoA carboxylase carboxyl transferase subunit alpha, partial [Oceanospirillaceae bacterium]|nr:acetyl-CoA carboxylase carboxyl transferase subunit alpha [Oceanospirillaceae bacterium]